MRSSYLLVLILLISSCKQEKNGLIEFDPRNLTENKILLSEIANDINYIPLDNSYTLGLIYDNIEFINNSIYLSEKDIGVLVFDKTGKTLRKIGSKGRGPGEFVYNYMFTVDEKTESVYVLDSGAIIKIYSKTGEFLRSFSLKGYGDMIFSIKMYNSNLYAFYLIQFENAEYKWITVDSLGNLNNKAKIKTPPFIANFTAGEGAYLFQNRISYWNSLVDTVFTIDDLNEKPSIIISPGEQRFPITQNLTPDKLSQYLAIKQIFETNRFLIIRYFFKNKKEFAIINKEDRKTILTYWEFDGSSGIVNDLDGGPSFIPNNYFNENGKEYLAGIVYSHKLKKLVSSIEFKNYSPKYPEKKKEFEILANQLKETDNPVLVIVKLKN